MDEDYYAVYLAENDEFLNNFVTFSKENRNRFGVTGQKELWPLEQLYNLLKRYKGGFILDVGQHACLGMEVKKLPEDGWYEVKYRDPFFKDSKTLDVNVHSLTTRKEKRVKIQWFGVFQFLESSGEQPGFTTLSKFKYKLRLPKEQNKLIQQDMFLCGDISAYLASKSNISFVNFTKKDKK